MKNFDEFAKNWMSPQKEYELKVQVLNQLSNFIIDDEKAYMTTFAAKYSLLLLAEYHEWLNS